MVRLIYRYIFLCGLILLILLLLLYVASRNNGKKLNALYGELEPQHKEKIREAYINKTNQECRFHTCFDLFQCKSNLHWEIKVYVYPYIDYITESNIEILPELSSEFEMIIKSIKSSKYFTSNITEACIFVPVIDFLSENGINEHLASMVLPNLKQWNGGTNHLFFNFFPNTPLKKTQLMTIATGNAMLAASNLVTTNDRKGFDVSIPVFNTLTYLDPDSHVIPYYEERRWKLVVSQLTTFSHHRDTLRKVEDSDLGILMLRKCLGTRVDVIYHKKLCKDGLPFSYPDILLQFLCSQFVVELMFKRCRLLNTALGYLHYKTITSQDVSSEAEDGTFCLILPGHYYGSTVLLDAMMLGCIPVFAMDDYILPLNEVIDWKRASVQIREYQLKDVAKILMKVDHNEIVNKRHQVFFLWKKYFSSINKITTAILDILNDRVFPHKKKSYEYGASPPLYLPLRPPPEKGFTAVILTYNRIEMLFKLMKRLDEVPSLTKIVVVWNNPYSNPKLETWPELRKPWKLVKSKTNRLTNRFYPFPEIETDAILAIDDDILMLTKDEIEFAYQAWREFPDRLVGFPARNHIIDPEELINGKKMKYKYESEWQNELTMVLTGAAFYHKLYNHWFTYMLPIAVKDYIDKKMNCEDIGMNFLINNLTGKPPIKVTPRKRFKCAQCNGNDSLWSETSHFIKRSECLSVFTQKFGRMPLKPIEYRVDPLLFQDNIPLELKRYPDLGLV